jgi:DNA-binding NtrC family response regulator
MKPLVLIVDDDSDMVNTITEQLTPTYRIQTASNGAQAIAQFQLQLPDVVLLDIRMPTMDGIEVQREMHTIDPTIPVIMLTAIQEVDRLATALKNGAFGYLPKPYDVVYLRHLLAAALSQRRRR